MRLNGAKMKVEKTGAVTCTVPWEVHSETEVATFTPSNPPLGLPITDRDAEESEVGTWMLTLTYEGHVGVEYSFDDENTIEVELDGSMAQDPIKAHPFFARLKTKYGWQALPEDGGKYGFPESMPGAAGTETALSSAKKAQKTSELYGVENWLVVSAIFRVSFSARNAPDSLLDDIGEAVENPPGYHLLGIPRPRGRNWLKLAPKVRRAGNSTRVVLEYQLSGPRKVNKDVYSFAQIAT